MDFKCAAIGLMLCICTIVSNGVLAGVLRRTPKVYNALITTDENLTPSRAYPVIQPHIHETAITYPTSYSYSGYSTYQPYESYSTAFNQYSPIQTFYTSRNSNLKANPFLAISSEQISPFNNKHMPENDQQLRNVDEGEKNVSENIKEKTDQTSTITNEIRQQNSNADKKEEFLNESKNPIANNNNNNNNNNNKNEIPSETLPIELNEYGLPPSLIPISSSSSVTAGTSVGPTTFSINNPINLLPFLYNSPYPLIYDQYSLSAGGYQSNPYLPPFGYYPPHIYFNDYGNQQSNKHSDNINNEIFSKDNSSIKGQQSQPAHQDGATTQNTKINNLNDNDELLSSKSSIVDNKNKSSVEPQQEPAII